jgi:hypothetical protein
MDTEKQRAIEAMTLFNEKTDELINSNFVKHMQSVDLKVSLRMLSGGEVEVKHTLPDQEIIKAFVLTIRFFIQDNESSSLRNLAKIFEKLHISDDLKNYFSRARNRLNQEFEKKSFLNLNGKELTYREIFDTFIFGGLAHANKEKKKEYDNWMKDVSIASLLGMEFYTFLMYFLNCIAYIRK